MRAARISTFLRKQSTAILAIGLIAALAGCTTGLRNKQLEKVAKDWSLVIRASQVIPIYPLSEDLQPGDVLLVSTPIEEQVIIYKKKGFLPLDQHLIRLYSNDYSDFYNNRYGIKAGEIPPAEWQSTGDDGEHNWSDAPNAAFPSYQFEVRTGAGLNLAIPIQGVPFALGLMNSGRADGTVTIADAYTYGLDNYKMEKLVRKWGNAQRILLSNYAPQNGKCHFLRVINRVYATGSVNVTVTNDESSSAEAGAGADRPVNLLGIKEGNTLENYNAAIQAINVLAKEQLPGVKVKIATASSRSVTLSEEFRRPLVIGYIGFDLPILQGGRLGPAISTLAQLTERTILPAYHRDNLYHLAALSHMFAALADIEGHRAKEIEAGLNNLSRLLPERYPFSLWELESTTAPKESEKIKKDTKVTINGFRSVIDYLGCAQTTLDSLHDLQNDAKYKKEYQAAWTAKKNLGDKLYREPALMEAVDFVFLGI